MIKGNKKKRKKKYVNFTTRSEILTFSAFLMHDKQSHSRTRKLEL